MTRHVIDTSVVIKWFLPLKAEENNVKEALTILDKFLVGNIECYQPPHFIAEVVGVLSRLRPEKAAENLSDLLNMDFHRVESSKSYATACSLSIALNHHTFDTLFHAVALETPHTTLITADALYYRKAKHLGCIVLLQDYCE